MSSTSLPPPTLQSDFCSSADPEQQLKKDCMASVGYAVSGRSSS
eukprot:CAMPEP_0197655194 /NCGR_PEP_ID=MMETSP1338-20131121/39307_1 /TAXON_ID=43686 ORGANISM="Pelagodinium beii, Strain RCC1491" /NCGR_SAMPLE_ID=MMETSP1338 /ASSEMBLY_ACC=CAM_ASM_000754 /LENGTH=43 /DNA_ID= /DNA_START= /DNA_END= /DNA_ORIENTATION=